MRIEVIVQIETRSCPPAGGRCSPWDYSETKFVTRINGPEEPIERSVPGGTLILKKATLTMSAQAKPVPPSRMPKPDGALVMLSYINPDNARFTGSYFGAGGQEFYRPEVDPFLFTYQNGWRMSEGGKTLALFAREQRGDNGDESRIVIQIQHAPRAEESRAG